jgi:glycosyltransferase involved in cell wall biosynthesis
VASLVNGGVGSSASIVATSLVSAIIPTWDRPELVVRAVNSALAQTWKHMEVVVVVDGPDAETIHALETHVQGRVKVVALRESVGGAEARNIGARQAQGHFVAFLDDDDEWLPEKIEKQLLGMSVLGSRNVLVASQFFYRAPGARDVIRPRRMPREGEPIVEFMFDHLCYFQTSTLLCSTDVILRIPFQKGLALFQDIDWFLRVNSDGQVKFHAVEEPLSIYYEPAQRQSMTSSSNWRDRLEWGRARRHLLGRRAYGRFVVGSCAARAGQERAGIGGLLRLLHEAVFVGSASPKMLALLLGAFLLPIGLRRQMRDFLFLKKRPYTSAGTVS